MKQEVSQECTEDDLEMVSINSVCFNKNQLILTAKLETYIIVYKNNRRKCEFFIVLGNGQVLLGMPDTAALNIINVNIESIEAENTQRENCNANIGNAKVSNAKQATHGAGENCTNTDDGLKILTITMDQLAKLMQTH